jgi:uncharacterized protein YkwD
MLPRRFVEVAGLLARGLMMAMLLAAALVGVSAKARSRGGGCPEGNTSVGKISRQATKDAVVCLINEQRAAHRLPRLSASPLLDRSAQGWTDTMVRSGSFSHGADFGARISAAGFAWKSAGENIATGYPTPHAVVNAWMASADHCRNILNPTYSSIGTGVVSIRAHGATWTQDFALAAKRRPPSGNWGPANGCPY